MRGTGFVVFEIAIWMVSAGVVGALVGWLVRGWRSETKAMNRVEAALEAARAEVASLAEKLEDAESARAMLRIENERLAARAADPTPSVPEATADDDVPDVGSEATESGSPDGPNDESTVSDETQSARDEDSGSSVETSERH